ncbi:MAG: hypothetical protein F8N36_01720 [Desulfovibrio sp.]|uniref:hypothetical protein n=1 Tax=Desulfovibrio sp. TaxID=885 RepID=UPI00135E5D0E|nr:hypothetical protein [Desulfovibrio sp.]MTJ91572.1 hypothetical protein [Desulfovibrio sp.]
MIADDIADIIADEDGPAGENMYLHRTDVPALEISSGQTSTCQCLQQGQLGTGSAYTGILGLMQHCGI